MRRDLGQMSFSDGLVNQRGGRCEWLDCIDRVVDWSAVIKILDEVYASDVGRPSFPLLTLVKMLLLQQWYGLSDPMLEEMVDDRLSFRRFVGLPLTESAPDHSTIWRFREELSHRGLGEALFQEVAHQMEARGLLVKAGTLIDATLIEAAVAPPPFKHGPVSPHDPDAGWTVRNGQSHFGYKAHLAVDEGSEIIRAAILTGAEVHDSQLAEALIQRDEGTVYGDKAYGSTALRAKLADAGIKDGLMHKAARGKPLKTWQRWLNKALSSIRAAVERTCARLTHGYELARARYRGLRRNGCHLHLVCPAINLKRWLVLAA